MRRKLASDCDGDVIAAGHAIKRTLRSEGHIHALAEGQQPNGGALAEAEISKLYDAGLRAAEEKHRGAADFANVEGAVPWHETALRWQRHSSRLRAKEQWGINDRASRTVWREPIEKQGKWLKGIFCRLGGKRP